MERWREIRNEMRSQHYVQKGLATSSAGLMQNENTGALVQIIKYFRQ